VRHADDLRHLAHVDAIFMSVAGYDEAEVHALSLIAGPDRDAVDLERMRLAPSFQHRVKPAPDVIVVLGVAIEPTGVHPGAFVQADLLQRH
jgi:hypothetical protein